MYLINRSPSDGKEEMREIQKKISKHIVLPQNEEPTLATVKDKTKLKGGIYTKAENGDKLLIYSKAQRVYLYRPSEKKLIDVGPKI